MKLDAFLEGTPVEDTGRIATQVEACGFHGLWLAETRVDPFLPLAVAATSTRRARLGTGIAVALSRSPMVTAMDAWAIQRASGGRLDLGLGTRANARTESGFAMPPDRPAGRIREYVAALRHIWGAFQHGHRLSFKGDFYSFSLMSPFFDPGPIQWPGIPVYLAALNERMFRIAGEVADGIVGHPFSTPQYLRDVGLPSLGRGLARAKRERGEITVACPVFAVVEASRTFQADERYAREQIGFYASTPTCRAVLDHHGWGAIGEELSGLARAGRVDELPRLVTPELFDAFVTRARTHAELGRRLRERYEGILDRVALYGVTMDAEATGALATALAGK